MIYHFSDIRKADLVNAGGNVPLRTTNAPEASFDPISDVTDVVRDLIGTDPSEGVEGFSLDEILANRDRVATYIEDQQDPTLDCAVTVSASSSHYAEVFYFLPLNDMDVGKCISLQKQADQYLIEAALEEEMTITTIDPDGPYLGFRLMIDGVTIPLATLLGHREYTCPRLSQTSQS
jgi:hypothetical protein